MLASLYNVMDISVVSTQYFVVVVRVSFIGKSFLQDTWYVKEVLSKIKSPCPTITHIDSIYHRKSYEST